MTVGELQKQLDQFPENMPVVIESAGIGVDDRTQIWDVIEANYQGSEEVHLVAENHRAA